MTQPAETFDTYDAKGNREDLADTIYNISPTDTPFLSMICDVGTATAVKHEWQTDALATASDTNARIEGDDFAGTAITATVRAENYCQISDKTPIISDTQEAVQHAGRDSEVAYQLAKAAKELKRDMEKILTGNQARVVGDATTARKLRSLEAWYTTNASRGNGGANGSASAAATDATTGDLRAFTEALLKGILESTWTSGGNPDILMVGPKNKQKVSGFTGNATRMISAEAGKLAASIDVYESDFGAIKVIPNRFQRDRTAHALEKGMWAVSYLRPFSTYELAKTSRGTKHVIETEYTLEARNEASSGVVADLTA